MYSSEWTLLRSLGEETVQKTYGLLRFQSFISLNTWLHGTGFLLMPKIAFVIYTAFRI